MRRQMPYSRIVVMIGARDLRQHWQPNDQPQQEEGAGASEGQETARERQEDVRTTAREDVAMGRDKAGPRLEGCSRAVERLI